MDSAQIDALAPHKTFPGNRPSTTILLDNLDARALGNLICAYEHKVVRAKCDLGHQCV